MIKLEPRQPWPASVSEPSMEHAHFIKGYYQCICRVNTVLIISSLSIIGQNPSDGCGIRIAVLAEPWRSGVLPVCQQGALTVQFLWPRVVVTTRGWGDIKNTVAPRNSILIEAGSGSNGQYQISEQPKRFCNILDPKSYTLPLILGTPSICIMKSSVAERCNNIDKIWDIPPARKCRHLDQHQFPKLYYQISTTDS